MAEIEDTGKVWFPGTFGPQYAVRVEDKVFVPGRGENASIHCQVRGNYLVVDLHIEKKAERILRRFPLGLTPATPGTLFNGFEKTKHADVLVVTHKDSGVQEFVLAGETYHRESAAALDRESFYRLAETRFRQEEG